MVITRLSRDQDVRRKENKFIKSEKRWSTRNLSEEKDLPKKTP